MKKKNPTPKPAPALHIVSPPKGQRDPGVPWEWSSGLKEIWWVNDTWDFDFHFVQCKDETLLDEWLKHITHGKHFVDVTDNRVKNAGAMHLLCTGPFGCHSIVAYFGQWTGKPSQYNALTHELTHLIFEVLEYKGMGTHHDAREAYCYLMGQTMEDLLKIIGSKAIRAVPWKWARRDLDAPKHPSQRRK